MSNYYADQLLASNYNGAEVRVVQVEPNGKILVKDADGKTGRATENYLNGFYHEVGTRIPTLAR